MSSFLVRAGLAGSFLFVCASAQAAPPVAGEQAVRAIEQSMRVLRKHPEHGDVFVPATENVTLRPNNNVIIVHHGFLGAEQRGFFPDENGKLPERQRAELASFLKDTDGPSVVRNVHSSINAHVAEQHRVARAEPLVKNLLSLAANTREGEPIFKQGRTRMYVQHGVFGPTLVVDKAFSLRTPEFELHKAADGSYELSAQDREKLGLILAPR